MAHTSGEVEYPIAAVSKLTGVSCHVLRVWERRYGFPVPHRTPSGHRRYASDQVLALRRVCEISGSGSGKPIRELIAEARAGGVESGSRANDGAGLGGAVERAIEDFLDYLIAGDRAGADGCFDLLEGTLGTEELVERVVAPAFTEIGDRWFRGRCAIYQERFATGFLRRRLDAMIESARRANAGPWRTVLVGSVQGERHEGGVLLTHLLLEEAGCRVINLGIDLPVSEFVRGVEALRPDALALSFVLSRNINKRFRELSALRGVRVFVGGRSVLNHQGVARRFGLTPVPGPAGVAIAQIVAELRARDRVRAVGG